jgi:hypothetical protein
MAKVGIVNSFPKPGDQKAKKSKAKKSKGTQLVVSHRRPADYSKNAKERT